MIKLNVPDMSCGHCKAAIEKTVATLDAKAIVNVDLENRTVTITSSIADDVLAKALADKGYPSTPV